jgi:two-component system, cell cycle response regulator DivK
MSTAFVQSTPRQSAPAFSVAKAKPLILIAEDSLDGREMMRTLLRLKGYDVVVAEDGVQAIDLALKNSPDLIFIDLELPRLDGISVARNIRRSTALRNVPIVVVSGHDPSRYEEAALAAGCSEYLMKPIDFERLDAILELNVSLANCGRTGCADGF